MWEDRTMTVDAPDTEHFSWGRVWELFGAHRGTVLLVLGLVVATSILGVVNPLLIQRMFDDALFPEGGPDIRLLVILTTVMVVVTGLTAGLGVIQTKATNDLGQGVLRELRDRVYSHLQSLSLSFYAATRTGELQSRISNDVGGVQTAVTTTLSSILSNLVSVAAALVAMFILSWQLTLLSLASVPFFIIATRWVGRRRRALTGETQRAVAEMNVITQ
ncbi:MAG: ABC transporter ATP-binding protein, partial [Acidimicrobiia bacterium]|nr:ABC transporter ATP-binding protein [Acidimicrobiia bacterium]